MTSNDIPQPIIIKSIIAPAITPIINLWLFFLPFDIISKRDKIATTIDVIISPLLSYIAPNIMNIKATKSIIF